MSTTQRFDQLFSLYHSFPLENNPHIHPDSPPGSIPLNPPPPFHTSINPGSSPGPHIRLHTRKFDGSDPAGLYSIDEYFDFYAIPHHERMRLVSICMEGQASKWLSWMRRSNALLQSKILTPTVFAVLPPPWIELPADGVFNDTYNVMCRRATDRSQGQLVDLTIQYFGDDALMDYIADRLPITYVYNGLVDRYIQNLYAIAISKSMPNLHHLQVFAHWMRNEGLELILSGCTHLKSLDIRRCFDLDLEGDLGKDVVNK
ncbi:hypothetical protein SASPL_121192 [Salvia splendens]|uniref:Uncharacterized protein n=1 Tax=Salvia splendens TaxID=180675 RepID=A0A8X8XTW4_SALSN|nr:hypothetical protein SASPL_121192 [Salvia splendens]